MSSCYTSWTTAKTGQIIPCFYDGKPSASLYNPQKEAKIFAELECFATAGFIVIAGFGLGLHIIELIKKYPKSTIVVIEANTQSIDFLRKSKNILIPSTCILCTPDTLYNTLLEQYYPPICGTFSFLPLRSWAQANATCFKNIQDIVQKALKAISADISVQSHFGKLWHRNILQNLTICENMAQNKLLNFSHTIFPTQKTAFIAGAGPSLDLWFEKLKKNRNDYYIIATDTAYKALIEHNVISDIVISVDPQHISLNHFLCEKNDQTVFAFDLCANPVSVQSIVNNNKTIFFFKSAHPLCTLAEQWYSAQLKHNSKKRLSLNENDGKNEFFPSFSSGNGTVTLAALHFAHCAGFTTITTGGADFAYFNGKPYAQGSYLDTIYNCTSTKLCSAEYQFSALMFRTELIKLDSQDAYTTPLLQDYKLSFDDFFLYKNIYTDNKKSDNFIPAIYKTPFPYKNFIQWYRSILNELVEQQKKPLDIENAILKSLLPYVAWYSHTHNKSIKIKEIFELGLKTTVQI